MYLISLVTTALVGSPPSAYIATAVKHEVDPFRAIVDFFEATPGRRRPPRDRPPATTRHDSSRSPSPRAHIPASRVRREGVNVHGSERIHQTLMRHPSTGMLASRNGLRFSR